MEFSRVWESGVERVSITLSSPDSLSISYVHEHQDAGSQAKSISINLGLAGLACKALDELTPQEGKVYAQGLCVVQDLLHDNDC